jgi:hypothetical protein
VNRDLKNLKRLSIMKKEDSGIWNSLFGARGKATEPKASTTSEVFVTEGAQPHVLRGKMMEKQLTHGETVRASLSPVRLESTRGKMAVYFCPMEKLEIYATLTPGDGGEIPSQVLVEGLTISSEHSAGLYALKNVELTSNGAIQVKTTAETTWEAV